MNEWMNDDHNFTSHNDSRFGWNLHEAIIVNSIYAHKHTDSLCERILNSIDLDELGYRLD